MAAKLSVVCWKWRGRRQFKPEYVNTLKRAVAANLSLDHEFVCVTDDPKGLDKDIRVVRLPEFKHYDRGAGKPSCYVRLWAFDPEFAKQLGERILTIDIDVVITGDLTPLVDRDDDFIIWCDSANHDKIRYQGGLHLMTAGARPQVWNDFDRATTPQAVEESGLAGSDQAWISMCLYPHEKTWDRSDGVYKSQLLKPDGRIPEDCRIMLPTGVMKPWSWYVKDKYPHIYNAWSKYYAH